MSPISFLVSDKTVSRASDQPAKNFQPQVIRKHEHLGLTTWFGNLTSAYGRSRHHGATEPPYFGDDGSYHPPPEYGDGTPIEREYLELALSIAEASQVLVKWKVGDVVLLDVSLSRTKPKKSKTWYGRCLPLFRTTR